MSHNMYNLFAIQLYFERFLEIRTKFIISGYMIPQEYLNQNINTYILYNITYFLCYIFVESRHKYF